MLPARTGDDVTWYRCRFTAPADRTEERHYFIRFGGAFLDAEVWLNGERLGGHYGYFAPFGFDVTDRLLPGENLLAVRCQSTPEEHDLKAKKHVLGVFGDWDCKPYPNHALSNPPPGKTWVVPLGLWGEVTLEEAGGVAAAWLRLTPAFPDGGWPAGGDRLEADATLVVEVGLHNPGSESVRLSLTATLSPTNFAADDLVQGGDEVEVGPGELLAHSFTLRVPRPALWWPWSHGSPNLYGLRLEAMDTTTGAPIFAVEQRCGFREVRAVVGRVAGTRRWEWWLNGRHIFPKGSNYICDFWLDAADRSRYALDLALARRANMDCLRVHAHVERDDLYRLADEQGILLLCDFPLTFCYVYRASEEDAAFFRAAVLAQLPEMVRLLGSHPSIVQWTVHNEPPWPESMQWFGEAHGAQANKEVDQEGARLVAELDPSRLVEAASGDHDDHAYNGWYYGSAQDFRNLALAFPTEFGAQALPAPDSPFWQTVSTAWPIEPEEVTWRYADYQPVQWAQHGVGEPGGYATLAEYVEASQAYQASCLQYAVDQMRVHKFAPTGGILQFMLTDCWPAISWSVLDYFRLPKEAYRVLSRAFNPTHVCIGFAGEPSAHDALLPTFPAGARLRIRLHVVNDDFRVGGEAVLVWRIDAKGGQFLASRLRTLATGLPSGRAMLNLPSAAEPAVLALAMDRFLPRGDYVLGTELWQSGRLIDRNRIVFRIANGSAQPNGIRQVPGFVARRMYARRSLRNVAGGATFRLRNEFQDAALVRVHFVRVDGADVPLARVSMYVAGRSVPAEGISARTPVAVRKGTQVTVFLEGLSLVQGEHRLEMAIEVAGVGAGALAVDDEV